MSVNSSNISLNSLVRKEKDIYKEKSNTNENLEKDDRPSKEDEYSNQDRENSCSENSQNQHNKNKDDNNRNRETENNKDKSDDCNRMNDNSQSRGNDNNNGMSDQGDNTERKQRKKTKRGKPIRNQLQKFSLFYSNCRGLKSKTTSINHIIDEKDPSMICIVESHLQEKEEIKDKFVGYELYRNDYSSDSGGILIGIKDVLKNISHEVHRYNEVGQSLWISINNTKANIRVGVVYAPQETSTKKSELIKMYKDIEKQVDIATQGNQKLLIIGDFNCKVGNSIPNNALQISKGGRLLLKLIQKKNLTILNSNKICQGLWTRNENGKKSVIDYVITKTGDIQDIKSVLIDEDKEHPVYRQIKDRPEESIQ